MRVFVTGATGFVGSAVVRELLDAGHQVLGMVRSDEGAKAVAAAGAQVHRGDLTDLDSLKSGAAQADAVIHTAFIHDFSRFAEVCEIDRVAIGALGEALAGSHKPLITTSGTALLSPGKVATEDMMPPSPSPLPRMSEQATDAVTPLGVRTSVIRLPPSVHGAGDRSGFVPIIIGMAKAAGASAYIGDGQNLWPAVHRLDAARLYRLVLEQGAVGARYHAVDDTGVPFKQIAEVIGRRLNLPVKALSPEDAPSHFSWFTHFAAFDAPASSAQTRKLTGWAPTGPGLIADVDQPHYFPA